MVQAFPSAYTTYTPEAFIAVDQRSTTNAAAYDFIFTRGSKQPYRRCKEREASYQVAEHTATTRMPFNRGAKWNPQICVTFVSAKGNRCTPFGQTRAAEG